VLIISGIYVKMGKLSLPFVGMIMAEFAQVGLIILSKQAMAQGMTNFIFIFYSNAIAALLLLPTSFLIHRLGYYLSLSKLLSVAIFQKWTSPLMIL